MGSRFFVSCVGWLSLLALAFRGYDVRMRFREECGSGSLNGNEVEPVLAPIAGDDIALGAFLLVAAD